MDITKLNSTPIKFNQNPFQKIESTSTQNSFANVLKGYLENVDSAVKQSAELSAKAAAGEIDNIHDVTIAAQKAKLALELTVTIRDEAVEAYQEMMRMQI
ncbi:flagellar hook-basal body complex protein FliE [Neobacillus citreus]|uniref:Flagellar hook-basal body complex protein FliE n=1 Tax=Neobacillus citreus TaxID=2833578 RepID=A0A942Y7K9_9BACI|nr:flagellar hook-basal body complex protein FliE [Neobacillus citreus]MCH6266824.1 flagellar hook-basal body complex protein FliE [Neobacillus citreus]